LLRQEGNGWYYRDQKLNLIASIDFAYSLSSRADYTTIVVVGVDPKGNYYVLDIDRFKTKLIGEYYEHLWAIYKKWGFNMLIAEVTAAQEPIVEDIQVKLYLQRWFVSISETLQA
jgi:hypothetical protein